MAFSPVQVVQAALDATIDVMHHHSTHMKASVDTLLFSRVMMHVHSLTPGTATKANELAVAMMDAYASVDIVSWCVKALINAAEVMLITSHLSLNVCYCGALHKRFRDMGLLICWALGWRVNAFWPPPGTKVFTLWLSVAVTPLRSQKRIYFSMGPKVRYPTVL